MVNKKGKSKALYIHIPFCLKKCSYCSFVSFPLEKTESIVEQYLSKLEDELDIWTGNKIGTIYFGGGTPSLLDCDLLKKLFYAINTKLNCSCVKETTIESNPATIDYKKLMNYKSLGINRISLGCQSFVPKTLSLLDRVHKVKDNYISLDNIKKTGFENVSVDLIYGIPGQTLNQFKKELEKLAKLDVNHISLYALSIENKTEFYKNYNAGKYDKINNDVVADMYSYSIEYLKSKKYYQYEISNFAKDGFECLHNKTYWQNEQYIGIGVSSCGYIDGVRYKNIDNIYEYINSNFELEQQVEYKEQLTTPKKEGERIILGLRMNIGVDLTAVEQNLFGQKLYQFVDTGLLSVNNNHIELTNKGRVLSNYVFRELV